MDLCWFAGRCSVGCGLFSWGLTNRTSIVGIRLLHIPRTDWAFRTDFCSEFGSICSWNSCSRCVGSMDGFYANSLPIPRTDVKQRVPPLKCSPTLPNPPNRYLSFLYFPNHPPFPGIDLIDQLIWRLLIYGSINDNYTINPSERALRLIIPPHIPLILKTKPVAGKWSNKACVGIIYKNSHPEF